MRRHDLDNIRWITVMLVVLYHIFYIYNAEGIAGGPGGFYAFQPWDAVQYLLYPWFMAILFVISGMSAHLFLDQNDDRAFLRARTLKLLVPSTIGLFFFHWITGYLNMQLSHAFEDLTAANLPEGVRVTVIAISMLLSGGGILWTLHLLWLCSIVLIVLRRIEKGRLYDLCGRLPFWGVVLLGLPYWGAAHILNAPVISVYKLGFYGFAFLLGYYVFAHEAVAEQLARLCVPFIAAAAVLGAVFVGHDFGENYAVSPTFSSPLSMAFSWLTVLAVLGGMKRWADRETLLGAWMRRRSFGLYVFHYFGIAASAYFLYPTGLPPILIYLLTGVCAYASGFLLSALFSRIPVFRWALLGMKKNPGPRPS